MLDLHFLSSPLVTEFATSIFLKYIPSSFQWFLNRLGQKEWFLAYSTLGQVNALDQDFKIF